MVKTDTAIIGVAVAAVIGIVAYLLYGQSSSTDMTGGLQAPPVSSTTYNVSIPPFPTGGGTPIPLPTGGGNTALGGPFTVKTQSGQLFPSLGPDVISGYTRSPFGGIGELAHGGVTHPPASSPATPGVLNALATAGSDIEQGVISQGSSILGRLFKW